MNKLSSSLILICLGLTGGYFMQPFIQQQLQSAGLIADSTEGTADSGEKKILYWVAPMDANYRRDEPGKSPMGMDLVPVYEDEGGEDGVVKISPVVQNNLGVRIASVKKGMLDREINTVGYIAFDEEKLFHIHTRVEGWVEKLNVKATGAIVKKGQKLFELYSPALVNAQEEYLTALKSKNRILIDASRDRLISLGVSESHVRDLDRNREVRQRINHYSRNDGFIQKLNVREGMFIKPAMDVLTIGQIDTVWVIAEVFERQIGWVKKDQSVDMTVAAYPEKSWQGVVDYIYPTLEQQTRTLRVRIRFDNKDRLLKPNMFSRMTIHSPSDTESLLVRREAIIRNGQMQRVVKALGDGKFKSVAVVTGDENSEYVEVTQGLEAGDQIVTSAQFLIDSESSLSASFERMQPPAEINTEKEMEGQVWITGSVENVMKGHSMLTIQHGPVESWGWPSMSMDFSVDKSIDLNPFEVDESIRFLVKKLDGGGLKIISIEGNTAPDADSNMQEADKNEAWINGTVENVMKGHSMLTIQHGPVESWGWPSMSMDFSVDKAIDLDPIKVKDSIRFLVKKLDGGGLKIISIEGNTATDADNSIQKTDKNKAWVRGKIIKVNAKDSKLTLEHEPVESWGWPQMMMDFPVKESLDIKTLQKNESFDFLVQKLDSGAIQIIEINKEGM